MRQQLPEEAADDGLEAGAEESVRKREIDEGELMEHPVTRGLGDGRRGNGRFGEEEESVNVGRDGVRGGGEREGGGAEEKGRGRVDENAEKVIWNQWDDGVRVGVREEEEERFQHGLE